MNAAQTTGSRSPFLDIADARLRPIGWALVTAPITTGMHHLELAQLSRAGYRFAGMPGYGSFPLANGEDARDYGELCEAWCHCFRHPDRFLPNATPRALISHSDFTDPLRVSPDWVQPRDTAAPPDYDFVYVGTRASWKQEAKGWQLAVRSIPRLQKELGLRALVVDAPPDGVRAGARCTEPLAWEALLARIRTARFLFVPNAADASPRTISEALCLDVPVVVNRSILGGWKYVNAFTGTFFDDEHNVVQAVRDCLGSPRSPRRWYRANYGPHLAGARLLRLLQHLDSRITERSYLTVTGTPAQALALPPRR